ncbi:hypothetical protein J4Q44_G00111880 [Coregonus suidteri]|uniref:PET domain-containing protein n=1 Tax=Coregonus suidteri TaxID=861788 RepID=A0AAN8LYV8_9TELE
MEVEKEIKKMTLGHEIGAGAACLKCKEKCEGFELHFWRKICRNCKCGLTDHDVQMNSDDNRKVGKLFEDTKYTGLIAKLKTDGVPTYKGNQPMLAMGLELGLAMVLGPGLELELWLAMVLGPELGPLWGGWARNHAQTWGNQSHCCVSQRLASQEGCRAMKSVTYEWAPPGLKQYMAVRYIELLPPERRPIAGTEGAAYRRQQMAVQLPEHDQDPAKCHELTPAEVKQMQQFVRKYKDEAWEWETSSCLRR